MLTVESTIYQKSYYSLSIIVAQDILSTRGGCAVSVVECFLLVLLVSGLLWLLVRGQGQGCLGFQVWFCFVMDLVGMNRS